MAQPYPEDHDYVSQILGLHVHVTGVLLSVNIPGLSQYLNS